MALRLAEADPGRGDAPRPILTVVSRRSPPPVYSPLARRRRRRPMAIRVVPPEQRA